MQSLAVTPTPLRVFSAKKTIPLRHNSLWLIKQGVVKTVSCHEGGTPIILGFWGAGDVVGLPWSQIQAYEICCLTPVEAICIPWTDDKWTVDAIRYFIKETEKLLYLVRCGRVPKRLFKTLVWLSQKFGHPVIQGQCIGLSITHQELADLIGTSRNSITKLLNQFEKDGLISRRQKQIIILRREFEAV